MTTASHIEALLKERIGLDAATVGPGMIERALRERLAAAAVPDHHAYWNLLHSHPDELQSLIEAVVVPETWFFRHREALLALGRFAATRVFGGDHAPDGAAPLRILSVPCSTGEEPYSIVMALLDAGVPEQRFQVDAVDVSARSLERLHPRPPGPAAAQPREPGPLPLCPPQPCEVPSPTPQRRPW